MVFCGINTEIALKNRNFIYATKSELYMSQRWKISITGILQKTMKLTVALQPGNIICEVSRTLFLSLGLRIPFEQQSYFESWQRSNIVIKLPRFFFHCLSCYKQILHLEFEKQFILLNVFIFCHCEGRL